MWPALVWLGLLTTAVAEDGHCVAYGLCHQSADNKFQNCPYEGKGKAFENGTARDALRRLCPAFADDDLLCCSPDQILNMEKSTNMARGILGRCPSCFHNFLTVFCNQACSPEQSKFIHIDAKENGTYRGKEREYITEMTYYLEEDYLQSVYKSCKNVQFSGSGEPALSLMCGGKDPCTGFDWFSFMGDPSVNQYAPFKINFVNKSGPFDMYVPLNVSTVPCSQAPNEDSSVCSCQDCPQACGAISPYPPSSKSRCKIVGVDCMIVISGTIFGGFCVIVLVIAFLHGLGRKRSAARYTVAATSSSSEGRVLVTEKDVSLCENLGAFLETKLEELFYGWGITCTRHPLLVFTFGLAISGVCSSGLYFVRFTTDPVELWSAPNSQAREEKQYFDDHFGPFYRTEQMIVVPKNQTPVSRINPDSFETEYFGPVFRKEFLHEVLQLQRNITRLVGKTPDGHRVTLDDICFKPMAPDNNNCTIQSLLQYFQNDPDLLDKTVSPFVEVENYGFFDDYGDVDSSWEMGDDYGEEGSVGDDGDIDYMDHIKSCIVSPLQVNDTTALHLNCLGAYGGPVFPYVVLGGFNHSKEYLSARALVIMFLVNNHQDPKKKEKAEAWEAEYIEYMHNFSSPNFTVSYMAERSIQDEIKRESRSDVITIVISYVFMFGYIAFALGQYQVHGNNLCYLLVHSKVMLGMAGVVIVALSVTSSIGVYAYCGIPATMIILEVQPFLVLAVGVDNIFIFVQAYQRGRHTKAESLEQRIGRISGEVVPSMLLSSLAECFCFFLGALSSMPAVKVFSLYAAMAIFFDFFLQITCFLALFTLDIRREEAGRLEVCCCARLPTKHSESEGFLYSVFKKCYSPFLLSKYVRLPVIITFVGWLFCSIAVLARIPVGLDQKLSVPEDSYVLDQFNAMQKYLSVGPPVYFVVKGKYDYSSRQLQNEVCGSAGCVQNSLYGQIYSASHYPNRSYISHPPMSWLDDYFDWLRPGGNPPCCRQYPNDTFCPATVTKGHCHQCVEDYPKGRPTEDDFYDFLSTYLSDNPSPKCAKGGHAAYSNALSLSHDTGEIDASHFMTYHTILKDSPDFISALKNARAISENITKNINQMLPPGQPNVEVFAYSVFYVFYEQYLTIAHDAVLQLLLSLGSIFVVTSIFLGLDPWSGATISLTIAMILLDLMALMYFWNIEFNAISLVNLVMAIGISVEFCSHIVRAFVMSVKLTRVERARDALANMGSSVLSGITLTKFGGIVVLAFSHSQIFKVYYFRMYLGIVLFGAAHGLVFLPVLLSFVGPSVNKRKLLTQQEQEQTEILEEVCPAILSGHSNSGEALVRENSSDALA